MPIGAPLKANDGVFYRHLPGISPAGSGIGRGERPPSVTPGEEATGQVRWTPSRLSLILKQIHAALEADWSGALGRLIRFT